MSERHKQTDRHPEVLSQVKPDDLMRTAGILSVAFEMVTVEKLAEPVARIIDAPHADMIVSRKEDGAIASVMVVNVKQGTRGAYGVIDDVATHPDSLRDGHAGAVLDYALDWFRERGVEGISLHSEDGREPAHELYKSRGFTIYDTNYFQLALT